jgi:hypothetical protein
MRAAGGGKNQGRGRKNWVGGQIHFRNLDIWQHSVHESKQKKMRIILGQRDRLYLSVDINTKEIGCVVVVHDGFYSAQGGQTQLERRKRIYYVIMDDRTSKRER